MWSEIKKHHEEFRSAVLTGLDQDGFPFSLRVVPAFDEASQGIALELPAGLDIQPGPACLLFHKHNQNLWNLKSFVLRGVLEQDPSGWRLRPQQFIPGMGIGGVASYYRLLKSGRRAARQYLLKRGLPRPTIPWDEYLKMLAEVKR